MTSTYVFVNGIVDHVLRNPAHYPGPHNHKCARTTRGLPQLEPYRQLELIWDGVSRFLKVSIEKGLSVYISKFGTISFRSHLQDAQTKYARNLHLEPYFQPCDEMKAFLTKKAIKVVTDQGAPPTGIYDIPSRVCYLNEKPIAACCYLPVPVVQSGIRALFQGILDLCERNYPMRLEFSEICRVDLVDRAFSYEFYPLVHACAKYQGDKFLGKIHEPRIPLHLAGQSTLKSMAHLRPDSKKETAKRAYTTLLRDYSGDLNTIAKVNPQRTREAL
mmetsp:Transcript_10684/g.26176  ORF Transcript_10684/g.26176 Transcript_10684/m.26176 type:complete len:274 (-) Transcript_10684:682-1503(-)|eukprot:g9660.t1